MDEDRLTRLEDVYVDLGDQVRTAIDAAASMDKGRFEQHGGMAEAARRAGVNYSTAYYAFTEYSDVVEYRRAMNASALDPEAVKAAYDDEFMQGLATGDGIATDGMGDVTVSVEFSLDEAFRAVKLLPGDLGNKVFKEVIGMDSVPKSGLDQLFEDI